MRNCAETMLFKIQVQKVPEDELLFSPKEDSNPNLDKAIESIVSSSYHKDLRITANSFADSHQSESPRRGNSSPRVKFRNKMKTKKHKGHFSVSSYLPVELGQKRHIPMTESDLSFEGINLRRDSRETRRFDLLTKKLKPLSLKPSIPSTFDEIEAMEKSIALGSMDDIFSPEVTIKRPQIAELKGKRYKGKSLSLSIKRRLGISGARQNNNSNLRQSSFVVGSVENDELEITDASEALAADGQKVKQRNTYSDFARSDKPESSLNKYNDKKKKKSTSFESSRVRSIKKTNQTSTKNDEPIKEKQNGVVTKPPKGERTPSVTIGTAVGELFIEVFNLNDPSNWLRRQAFSILLKRILGGTLQRRAVGIIEDTFSYTQLAMHVKDITDILWPASNNHSFSPPNTVVTEKQRIETSRNAKNKLLFYVPLLLGNIVGRKNAYVGANRVFNLIQAPRLNAHLILTLFDAVIYEAFPEIKNLESQLGHQRTSKKPSVH
ncbi:hypothetical protein BB560_001022 [Smittium megazygosporum]|uniref:Sorting nexin C-terminal domain-containing protein n=1 Tax=Smittium megazygosporum TaxID=133381 RepID=A0A2T9ZIQ3_9FUNG|nr:hypothetical protein BB560_001022 [Smittium megazygosporum]